MNCYQAALRILNYRFNSEAELRRKLSAKDFDAETIDATIARLREEKWLDDERFAGAFVRTRQLKKVGRGRVRRELAAAGVARDVAARAIAENADPERERQNLRAAAEKKRQALERRHGAGYAASREGRAKLTAYLIQQGYDSDAVRSALHDEES